MPLDNAGVNDKSLESLAKALDDSKCELRELVLAANDVSEFLAPPPKKISAFPENYNSALRPADQLKPPYHGL